MEYSELVSVYDRLGGTSSRLEMTSIVAEFIREVSEEELPVVMLLLEGRVFPLWSGKELGVGYKLVLKALSAVSGVPEEKIEDLVRETGDTGLAAEKILSRKAQTTLFSATLTVDKVYGNFERLASVAGKGSQDKKIALINELLSYASPAEARYIVRTILGELRLGVGEGILRDAIAQAYGVDSRLVERAFFLCCDYGEVARISKSKGDAGLREVNILPGRPVASMLAQKLGSVEEALKELGTAAFEIKYDGARLQIHKTGDKVFLYTRRLENVTRQFPEVVEYAIKQIKASSAVVEGEMVAIKSSLDRRPRAFQDLSKRIKRKYDIKEMVDSIPVEVNLFDALYYDGRNLLDEKFRDRRRILSEIVEEGGHFRLAEQVVTSDLDEAEKFYQKALSMGHEGVMAKNLESPYQPGSRVGYMYKIKPVMETLDLVVVGATWGEGRRANWLGSYLLAARDPDTGQLLSIGRMATGFTDELLEEMTDILKPEISEEVGKEVKIRPKVVVEVAYEEIQKSPTYESGYALRFPRLVRVRHDKGPEDADTIERVEELFNSSSSAQTL